MTVSVSTTDAIQISPRRVRRDTLVTWRADHHCGSKFPLNGKPAECNPDGGNPCCSKHGWCGNTEEHCDCSDCINFATKDTFPTACGLDSKKTPSQFAKEVVNTFFDSYSDRMERTEKIYDRLKEAGKNPRAVIILKPQYSFKASSTNYECVKYKDWNTLIFM